MDIQERFDNVFPKGDGRRITPIGILLHSIAKELEGLAAWEWLNANYNKLKSSAHFFVGRDFIIQTLPTNIRANHAGPSYHLGVGTTEDNLKDNLNYHYLGIEFLANFTYRDWRDYKRFKQVINIENNWIEEKDEPVYFMDQLLLGTKLVNHLIATIPTIEKRRVERHSVVSPDSLRGKGNGKIDPGRAFPMEVFTKNII